MDWAALEQSAGVFAGSGSRVDGATLARLRGRISSVLEEATTEVTSESGLDARPDAELLVVDRRAWIAGNVRTMNATFGDLGVSGPQAKLVAWEGGAFLGLVARAVLAQYDPYRDMLIVVYPNLGQVAEGDGLRWLLFHEVTHVAQFRNAPWMGDYIVDLGKQMLSTENRRWVREVAEDLSSRFPDLIRWARAVLEGRSEGTTPLLEILPEAQREIVFKLHSLVTLLEGHATYVTDRIAERVIPDYQAFQRRIREQRKRPPLLKLLEAVAGLEMKRQQYVIGRGFCEAVWQSGGARALAPAWASPEGIPTQDELQEPDRWLARMSSERSTGT